MKPAQWHGGDNIHVTVHHMQGGDSHQEIETYHHHHLSRNQRLEEDTSQKSAQSKSTGRGQTGRLHPERSEITITSETRVVQGNTTRNQTTCKNTTDLLTGWNTR